MKFAFMGSILLAGALFLQCGNPIDKKEATKHFKNGNTTYEQGIRLLEEGKFEQARPLFLEAIESYETSVKLFPDYGSVYVTIGDIHIKLRDYSRAAEAFTKILKTNPNHDQALSGLGLAHLHSRNFKESVAAYEKAIKLQPAVAESYFYCAISYKMLKQDAKARAYLQKAIGLQKTFESIARDNLVLKDLF